MAAKVQRRVANAPGIIERISATGEKSFLVRVRLRGFDSQVKSFKRLTDARAWQRQTMSDMQTGRALRDPQARKRTFGELAERYLGEVMPGKAARFQQIQTSQLAFWRGHFGNECLLSKITPALIQEGAGLLSRTMTQRGKLFTPATINRYLTLISHVFSVAVSWQWLAESPASHIRRGKEPPGRTRWLDDDEREKLLAACAKSSCPFLLPIVTVALCTGARRAEILNLTWRDVDLKAGSVTFPKTKNGSPRTVPLTGAALESLREHAKTRRRLDTPLLFPSYHKPQNPILIRDPWLQAVAAAGLENFRFHDLRHSAGSYLIMSGADLRVVAQILGHKEMRMTMRYTHLSEAFTREALQKMTTKFMK